MIDKTLTKADLAQFTGTAYWYRHAFVRNVLYTDGVQYVARTGGAYWLIDEIAFGQAKRKIAAEPFQVWTLKVKADQSAVLTCEDGYSKRVFTKKIIFTDFPLNEIMVYFTNNVILLPSEN